MNQPATGYSLPRAFHCEYCSQYIGWQDEGGYVHIPGVSGTRWRWKAPCGSCGKMNHYREPHGTTLSSVDAKDRHYER